MAEGAIFNVVEEIVKKLDSLVADDEVTVWWGFKDHLRKLKGTLTAIKDALPDAEYQAQKQNNQVRGWLEKLGEGVFDVEDLLDDFSTEVLRKKLMYGNRLSREVCIFFSRSNQFMNGLWMSHKVKELRKRIDDLVAESQKFGFEVREEEKACLSMVREKTAFFETEVIVGREGDKTALKNFLLSSNYKQNVSVISIVGIGGLGKTTLAQHVFNDEQVKVHFGLKLWVRVSGGLDVKKILKQAVGRDSEELENLKNELEKKIAKKKYLLVLDGVWDGKDGQDSEKWDCLKKLLPHDATGSKILVTTPSHVIAKFTSTAPPYVLEGLSVDESWDLFRRKAFPQGQESDHVDKKIRKEIIERCCGVPLVIKSIAGLMSLIDRAQWLSFIVNELPDRFRDDSIIQTIKLSYDPLPSYMKHCFAFCSLFPKACKINVKTLIQLWIAEGFINSSNSGGECLEIAGHRCFENLLWMSFFHEVEKDDLGNIESCKMHDLVHDLATIIAGLGSTRLDMDMLGENRFCPSTRHVSFDMKLDLSQQIPIPSSIAKRLRTLIWVGGNWSEGVSRGWSEGVWESTSRNFRRLRVLDLHLLGIKKVLPVIEKVKHLRYLDLSFNNMVALPNSITNLVNLEVLKLNGCKKLKELPRDTYKLINLRHLDVGCCLDGDLCVNLEYMPCGIGKLTCLQTLSCFVIAKIFPESKLVGGLDEMSRLNELRGRLEIRVLGYERNSCMSEFVGAKLIEKQYLQSLAIAWNLSNTSHSDTDLHEEMLQTLHPNLNLQELEVRGYGGMRFPIWLAHLTNLVKLFLNECGSCKKIPPLHGIPCLEVLCIGRFPSLEYIDSMGLDGRGALMFFPSLKKLKIMSCHRLKGWWKKSDEINDDSDDELTSTRTLTEEELRMICFPRLSSLKIIDCPNLTSMPLFPSLNDKLHLENTSSVALQQTMKMTASRLPSSVSSTSSSSSSFIRPLTELKGLTCYAIYDMESLPEDGLQNLSSLQQLSIWYCPRLKALHLPDQGMHSLQKLRVWNCGELRSLSESQSRRIPHLPSLQELLISECSEELSGKLREGKEAVEYWSSIKHIPNISVDNYYIQRDGRYVNPQNFRMLKFSPCSNSYS